jgi:hypothetical protein
VTIEGQLLSVRTVINMLHFLNQHINYCSHAEQLTFNCHKGRRIMAQLFILSYSDAVSFRDIRGHLGTIPSIVISVIFRMRKVCKQKNKKEGTL